VRTPEEIHEEQGEIISIDEGLHNHPMDYGYMVEGKNWVTGVNARDILEVIQGY
jgi:hypothetical protein